MNFDLIIVGAGLAGSSLAAALRDTTLNIALIEGTPPAPPPLEHWDARIYAISPANQRFLESLQAWQRQDGARLTPVREMEIRGDMGARMLFSAYEAGVAELAWIIESSVMTSALWQTLDGQANLTRFCPDRPARVELGHDCVTLDLESGQQLTAHLIVAADGTRSWLREAAGIRTAVTPYGEKGVVANFLTEKPHFGTAFQWFREDGVLAFLPLPGNAVSIVWSTPDAHADELVGLDAGRFTARVRTASGDRLGEMQPVSKPAGFPLRLLRAERSVARRMAMIGDAAHGIHPLSGHGINLGFQDARVLADLLSAADGKDIGSDRLLGRYERARAGEVTTLQYATHALQRLFRPRNPLLASLRNAGLNLTDQLPVVKSLLARYAMST